MKKCYEHFTGRERTGQDRGERERREEEEREYIHN